MKVKNGKLISMMETLNDILEIDGLPIESQFMIVEFYKKLEVIFDSYDKTRRKAYEKLALKNEDGKYINENGEFLEDGTLVVPKERLGDLEKEITKLNEIENDIPWNPIETLRFTKDEREALKKLKPKNLLIFPEFIKRN